MRRQGCELIRVQYRPPPSPRSQVREITGGTRIFSCDEACASGPQVAEYCQFTAICTAYPPGLPQGIVTRLCNTSVS